ncbi:alpha-ketoacid dehydrogenase subunit beta [Antarcticimicrobium luteum]|uniref:Alpha-ketoacid dehydrogenase subunit beta n=1 Tax=Antarcticimicrobium luteum TaxID=2547397 RepID=A0A4R5UQK6_9RHOB|nr:alpha-ketoacid dehydrogenase subunit beta [Antarcticimicrobium luteum]TDK41186.1 alpha-ketoacid dehydrogenase subunit beta [Antarcticimicrobium luteum]
MTEIRYIKAVNQALWDAMEADPSVFLIGEDIGAAGGSFKATRDLLDRFGPERVYDTPISEAAIAGMAVGAALTGMRPVAEIMFMDFTTLTMDMLVNQAAKARSMFGGQGSVPMVLRTPHGGGLNAGPQHSQCLEAWFAHVPGLKVVCPANPADAYGLLRAAIDDPDPVIVVENKALYAMKGDLPDAPEARERIEIGKGRIVRPGHDATVVAYGAAVTMAEAAAANLAGEGIDVEVIDLRSLQPWDEGLVLESLSRTHNLVVAHEAVEAFGIGAEIAARMADIGFDELDGPITRVGAPFAPSPFGKTLEDAYRPNAERIEAALRRTLA